jgi:ADP-heptose:LPS heptosyltransferase
MRTGTAPVGVFHAEGPLPGVRRIGVLRANMLGDFIFALPALHALRAAYPEAEVVLLGRAWHRAFLHGRPGPVHRVLVVPEGAIGDQAGTTADPDAIQAFIAAARAEHFDLAVQIHGGGRNSNPFLLRCDPAFTIGLRQPEVLRYLEVVALAGARTDDIEPRIHVTACDVRESEDVVPDDGRPLVALHPGASAPARRWPPQRFAAVGDALAARGLRVVVTGTRDEVSVVRCVLECMASAADDACGRLSVGGLAGLLSRCLVVVSNDTGPLHLAMAVGTPAVGIYWCGNLINAGPFSRRFNRPVVSWQVACRACGVNTLAEACDHGHPPVDDVRVDDVLQPALDLLQCD